MIFICLTALYPNQDQFSKNQKTILQFYLETLWNSANLTKDPMLATAFKANYCKPKACSFEKLAQYSMHKQEGLWIVAKICFRYERDLSELIKFYSP